MHNLLVSDVTVGFVYYLAVIINHNVMKSLYKDDSIV